MKQENRVFSCIRSLFGLFIIGFLLGSCSGTRHLPEGKLLYTGADVALQSVERVPSRGQLINELEELVRPDPNPVILGMRPQVWIYNITKDTADSGWLKRWMHTKIGSPPVLLEQTNPEASANLIQNRLYNSGYFDAEVDFEIVQKKRTAGINYIAKVVGPYRIDSIAFPKGNNVLEIAIASQRDKSLLKEGRVYNVDDLVDERERIARAVRDTGFYYFAPDNLLFKVDSTLGKRKVNLFLEVKKGLPKDVGTQFRMGSIAINPDFNFMLDTAKMRTDTTSVNGYSYVLNNRTLKPEIITESVFLKPDSLYSRTAHEQTINRLMGMNVFQYANIRFERPGNGDRLNAAVHLTPMKRRSISVQLQWVNSSFYTGPNFNVAYQNRNLLRAAELFELRLSSVMEFDTGGEQRNFTSYSFGIESAIYFPRFAVPIIDIRNKSSYYVPQTRAKFGFERIRRVGWFTVNSFNFAWGYGWNETRKVKHDFNIIDVNFYQFVNKTARFNDMFVRFPFIQRNYQEQFILGANYSYTYNSQLEEGRRNNFYFNGFIDVSGNLMQLLQSSFRNDEETVPGKPHTIFNRAYSQFARFSVDFRHYYSIDQKNTVASRLFIGAGFPYGNSTSMPFIKQYFSGGTNSIRAFPARSIGPGLIVPDENARGFYDQLGDMKIEGNLEYRFPIYGFLKGALFLESGNIWMISKDAEPASRFDVDTFLDQLAVGTGLGLRIDLEFFLLRFDFGVPLRVPQGWVWKPLPPTVDKDWNNIAFNIGIGYSF